MTPSARPEWRRIALLMGVLAVAAFPLFFSIYRESVFQTTPRDDYAPMLQSIVGQGGDYPGAPMGYRVLSVSAAAPLYFVLPPVSFSQLGPVDPAYLKATEALTAVSFLCMVGFAGVMYHIARSHYRASVQAAAITGVLGFLLTSYTQQSAIDPLGLLLVAILVVLLPRPALFAVAVLISAAFNEKVPLVLSALLVARCVHSYIKDHKTPLHYPARVQLVAALVALLGYQIATMAIGLPGAVEGFHLARAWSLASAEIRAAFTLKGLALDLVPVAIIVLLGVWAAREPPRSEGLHHGGWADVWVIPALLFTALAANVRFMQEVQYNFGRISMYALGLYLPAIAVLVDRLWGGAESPTPKTMPSRVSVS